MKKTPEQIKREILQDGASTRSFDPSRIKRNDAKTHILQAKTQPVSNPRNERDAYYMKSWIGKWCSFEMDVNGITNRYAGCITRVEPIADVGNVPNYRLSVTGRTGKQTQVNLVLQYARIFDKQEQAIEDTK